MGFAEAGTPVTVTGVSEFGLIVEVLIMTLIILLFALGIVLVAVEVIVPGGILGAIGGADDVRRLRDGVHRITARCGGTRRLGARTRSGGARALPRVPRVCREPRSASARSSPPDHRRQRRLRQRGARTRSANPPRRSPCSRPAATSAWTADATKPSASPARLPPARRSKSSAPTISASSLSPNQT